MSLKTGLSREEIEVLNNEKSRDFARVVRKGATFFLMRHATSYMEEEQAARFNAYRAQQAVRASLHPNERTWFDQIHDRVTELVDDMIIKLDDNTGGYGQRGTAWAEQQLSNMSTSLRKLLQ